MRQDSKELREHGLNIFIFFLVIFLLRKGQFYLAIARFTGYSPETERSKI